jgi:Ulp1 family protease
VIAKPTQKETGQRKSFDGNYINRSMVQDLITGGYINGAIISYCLSVMTEQYTGIFYLESTTIESMFNNKVFIGGEKIQRSQTFMKDHRLHHYKQLLIPINFQREHWTLCHVDVSNRRIYSYDSLRRRLVGRYEGEEQSIALEIIKFLNYWGENDHEYEVIVAQCPQQMFSDCGPLTILNAKYSITSSDPSRLEYDISDNRKIVMKMIEDSGSEWIDKEEYSEEEVEIIDQQIAMNPSDSDGA